MLWRYGYNIASRHKKARNNLQGLTQLDNYIPLSHSGTMLRRTDAIVSRRLISRGNFYRLHTGRPNTLLTTTSMPEYFMVSHSFAGSMGPMRYNARAASTEAIPAGNEGSPDDPSHWSHNFFHFTAGRWLQPDERLEAARHYRHFDPEALASAISEALAEDTAEARKAPSLNGVWKFEETDHARGFFCTLEDGRKFTVHIQIPHYDDPLQQIGNPYPHYNATVSSIVKSEVATMEYARTVLGLPVPRVVAWCADASSTPVQAEYIITEAPSGVRLCDVWDDLSLNLRVAVVEQLSKLETKLLRPLEGGYGSIFFREDVDPSMAIDFSTDGRKEERFVLGPSVEQRYRYRERQELDTDRGPWRDALSWIRAMSNVEHRWIEKFAPLDPEESLFGPPASFRVPSENLKYLELFHEVAPYFVPPESHFLRPTLNHATLSNKVVYISQEALDQGEIVISSIVDWKHHVVQPLYAAARIPTSLNYFPAPGDQHDDPASNLPKLYEITSLQNNPEYYEALTNEERLRPVTLLRLFTEPINWGFLYLRMLLAELYSEWETRTGEPKELCPIQFTEEEMKRLSTDIDLNAITTEVDLRAYIGVTFGGFVDAGGYEQAKQKSQQLLDMYLAALEDEGDKERARRLWPYRPPQ
ncbi:hypothetical protein BXZ70DRAFT_948028 [Cristinia sonorae]|uniref:Aminoglycoside phosphotransferase domain-containing protein n=1 Tax=Cristinia sonorae TaxID=1940300 RepID=A0A8K0XMW0_9AGAR|nr:hypothetical protein BXZ70DRAFT_948028 [Cristinia sonorae]